jgi:3-oxoacyl-[acyl-carrier protein] reductase
MENFSLKDRVALVTGASRGIGASIAKRLAEAGATVVVNYRGNKEAAEKVLSEIKGASSKSEALQFDVADFDQTQAAMDDIVSRLGKIDILVCNAGISRDNLLPRTKVEQFKEVLDTNLVGTFNCVRVISRSMMKNRYGRIICISSVVGETGNKGQVAYAASKSALFGLAKSVAQELGSRNITCNVIAPGFIETEMTEALDDGVKEDYFAKIPAGRFGKAEEVASTVQFLASEEAAYITGATLDINGGLSMR